VWHLELELKILKRSRGHNVSVRHSTYTTERTVSVSCDWEADAVLFLAHVACSVRSLVTEKFQEIAESRSTVRLNAFHVVFLFRDERHTLRIMRPPLPLSAMLLPDEREFGRALAVLL
jgi:hypothetical protein